MNTKGLIEVILYVRDMHAQVAFYRDIFGLTVSYPSDQTDFGHESWATFETGPCTLALHAGAQGNQGTDAPKIVFGVDDLNSARQTLLDRGVTVGEIRTPAPGVAVCDGVDPEGNKFSIESHE